MRDYVATRDLAALDKLANIQKYLRKVFSIDMSRADAKANFDARAKVFTCQNKIMAEYGIEISNTELQAAIRNSHIQPGACCRRSRIFPQEANDDVHVLVNA